MFCACASADMQSAKSMAPSKIANLRIRNAGLKLISKESIQPRPMVVPLNPQFGIRNPKSLDHPIRPRQHVGWNRQADLLGGFQIDDEFKLRRLLHWQLGSLSSLENFIDVIGDAPVAVRELCSVVQQPTGIYRFSVDVHRR